MHSMNRSGMNTPRHGSVDAQTRNAHARLIATNPDLSSRPSSIKAVHDTQSNRISQWTGSEPVDPIAEEPSGINPMTTSIATFDTRAASDGSFGKIHQQRLYDLTDVFHQSTID